MNGTEDIHLAGLRAMLQRVLATIEARRQAARTFHADTFTCWCEQERATESPTCPHCGQELVRVAEERPL